MTAKHPTIHDVAGRAGVSKSLVSLVMRGTPNISDASRAAVLKAAKELGYRPNLAARSLVQRRSHNIGVLVSDLHNPFFHETIDGVSDEAVERDYRTLLASGRLATAQERLAINSFLELRVDGMILLSPRLPASSLVETGRLVPLVVVGLTTKSKVYDSIAGDETVGAGLVVDHLVELGHRNIAHIHGGTGAGAGPRRAQYEQAMIRHGLDAYLQVAPGDFTVQGGVDGMRKLLSRQPFPTAVFVANDFSAMGALEVLDNEGIRVPEDMSLVGYDNVESAAYHRIALTTVDQPRFDMGRMAVGFLLERIEQERTISQHAVLPPKLVVRATTGPPRFL